MASNTSGSQPVFTVEWNAAFGMNTAWPGPTSKVSESSTICSPRPLRMYRISSLSGWLWRSCPSPGSSTTRMRLIAGRAEEPAHALRSLEDVLRVLRFGQPASVAEHHHLGIARPRRVAHRLDQLDAFVQRER